MCQFLRRHIPVLKIRYILKRHLKSKTNENRAVSIRTVPPYKHEYIYCLSPLMTSSLVPPDPLNGRAIRPSVSLHQSLSE
jgi:hypothetical protein